jgi:hypothetical protein
MYAQTLERWLTFWQKSCVLPRGRKPSRADWQAAIERFITALKLDLKAHPISWWQRIRLLHDLQKSLAAQSLPSEALRPLVMAIILHVYLG